MTKPSLSITLALALATTIGFVSGYFFHFKYGVELPAARQALAESHAQERVLEAYKDVLQTKSAHETLASIRSIEQLQELQSRFRNGAIAAVDRFAEIAQQATDPNERVLAQHLLPSANEIRAHISAASAPSLATEKP
ncbi:MAG: hypothetical protein EOO15_19730 [Chitinophagaceae bacterium]|nr:MAG: hypothetical protein EOO15_19730 [Chitinophagaceae bacterium]